MSRADIIADMEFFEVQKGTADFNDLAAVLKDAQKGFTIDFQAAVLAALMRIEDRLQAQPATPVFVADFDDPAVESLMMKLCERPLRPGSIVKLTSEEMSAFRRVKKVM